MFIGKAKGDITAFIKGVGMLGYGMYFNIMKDIATPLYCRSFVFKNASNHLVIVAICELAFITDSLKQGVLKKLESYNIQEEQLLLLAQHTHSGPGGFSFYALYNFTTPGFVKEIYELLVDKIANTIIASLQSFQSASISIAKSTFTEDIPVAFNRSLDAYNQNKDVIPLKHEERHKAVNREMTLLHIEDKNHRPIASINWFGVHTTSVSNDNHSLCSDNKGYAATYLENELAPDYIGAFAQGACGDISPKFIFNPKRKAQRGHWEGKFSDDFESAKYNGQIQFTKALEIIQSANKMILQSDNLQSYLQYFDFSNIKIDEVYTGGLDRKFTSPACQGMAFLAGSKMDGPGAPRVVEVIGKKMARAIKRNELNAKRFTDAERKEIIRKYEAQGPKDIIIESGIGKILGTADIKNVVLPGIFDGGIKNMKKQHRDGALITKSWTPQILPLQWIQIGELLLIGFPFEITTVASYRLHKSICELVADSTIKEVILCPYANSYNGYITTYEEYQIQMYEGGHTVFGEWSLAALQTCFKNLYTNIKNQTIYHSIQPLEFSEEEIRKRSYKA
ncbi:MAG: neutral/alkaline non-lysosomal ceramidase N-terminal domain-containing protein [Bacteroidota bacterium]